MAGIWDSSIEKVSLGGLLLLRQELELLAAQQGGRQATITFIQAARQGSVPAFAGELLASEIEIATAVAAEDSGGWPPREIRQSAGFSYMHFERIASLARDLGVKPRLRWSARAAEEARKLRAGFPGPLVALHLKNVPGETEKESNADARHWAEFLGGCGRRNAGLRFVLLGSDPVADSIRAMDNVSRLHDLGVPLSTQLALVAVSDGFMGMASGIAAAAVLSDTPYVLFKHPEHHVTEMRRELGDGNQFPFAAGNQQVWRRTHEAATLERALSMVLGDKS